MARPLPAESGQWFVRAAGRVWGPYPEARLFDFVEEGRIAPGTLVGPAPEGPFAPAAHQARLYRLFGGATPETGYAEPAAARPEPRPEPGPAEPLLVWAQLKSRGPEALETWIGVHGPYVRVMPGMWLVKARSGPAGLRNALTRKLEKEDRVVVVAASLAQAAWFNLDGETDRTLRQLWMSGN